MSDKVTHVLPYDKASDWPMIVTHHLRQAYKDWGKDVLFHIKPNEATRTDAQRKLMWVWHGEYVKHRAENYGEIFSKEHWHEVWKQVFLGCEEPVKIKGEWRIIPRSTGNCTVKEIAEALTRYEAEAAQEGCVLSKPNDCYLNATMRERMEESEREGM